MTMLDESVEHSLNTIPVKVWIDVDAGIAPLIRALNRIEGLRTMASCQGHRRSMYECRAHVMLWHRDGEPFWERMDAELTREWERLTLTTVELLHDGGERAELYVDPDGIEALAAALEGLEERDDELR